MQMIFLKAGKPSAHHYKQKGERMKADDRAKVVCKDLNLPECGPAWNAIRFALKEQDRDTRHACAEACLQHAEKPAIEMIDACHNSCMNVNIV